MPSAHKHDPKYSVMTAQELLTRAIKRNSTRILQSGHDGFRSKAQLFKHEEEKHFVAVVDGQSTTKSLCASSVTEAVNTFANTVGIDLSYAMLFSAGLETSLNQHGRSKRTTFFVKETDMWKVGSITRAGTGIPRQSLLPEAKQDIDGTGDDPMDPRTILRIYGTFYVESITLGGRDDTYLSTESSKKVTRKDLQVDAKAKAQYMSVGGTGIVRVKAGSQSALKDEEVTMSREVKGGDVVRWTSGAIAEWRESTKSLFDVIEVQLQPIWYLCSTQKRGSALEHAARKMAEYYKEATKVKAPRNISENTVKDRDVVYIMVNASNLWLSKQTMETYSAMAGSQRERARFRVEFGLYKRFLMENFDAKYFRLIYMENDSYLTKGKSQYRCLYAAVTGSTKYDVRSDSDLKQMWVLDRTLNTNLKYGESVQLFDLNYRCNMAVNTGAIASGIGASR